MECDWIRTTEPDLAALRDEAEGTALLPLGSIETHGPHLPLGSDTLVLQHLLGRITAEEKVAVLPLLPYSYVPAASAFHGAIHLDSALLINFVEAICDEIHRNGFTKIILLHGHGGNVPLHLGLANRCLERSKPYALYSIPPLPGMGEFIKGQTEWPDQGHACEMETSMNLAAAPECVRLDRVRGRVFARGVMPDLGTTVTPVDWIGRWPLMAVGKPELATREKGEAILAEWVRRAVELISKIKRDTIVPRILREHRDARNSFGKD
jgi:creatinine amidohydrolase